MKNTYKITILRPGGNDQLLIEGVISKEKRRKINDSMIQRFPNVEQVSFYEYDKKTNTARLELAGGEFCGNATRSLAYFLLEGKKGEVLLNVSGTTSTLKAGVRKKNTAYAQMPIIKDLENVRQLEKDLYRVDLEGIVHLVCTSNTKGLSSNELKKNAQDILKKGNLLLTVPAAGVMFINPKERTISLKPVVWVRDIETLLYETACASGSTAVGLWNAKQSRLTKITLKLKQPTGMFITVTVEKDINNFTNAYIEGPVKLLKKGVITL